MLSRHLKRSHFEFLKIRTEQIFGFQAITILYKLTIQFKTVKNQKNRLNIFQDFFWKSQMVNIIKLYKKPNLFSKVKSIKNDIT